MTLGQYQAPRSPRQWRHRSPSASPRARTRAGAAPSSRRLDYARLGDRVRDEARHLQEVVTIDLPRPRSRSRPCSTNWRAWEHTVSALALNVAIFTSLSDLLHQTRSKKHTN